MEPTAEPPAPRRPWRRRLVILVVVLTVIGLLAPTLAAPFVRPKVVAALEESFGAKVELDGFTLDWPGSATLSGLRIHDGAGLDHLRAERAEVSVAVWAALAGRYRADVQVYGWAANALRRPDDTWSFSELGGEPEPDSEELPKESEPIDLRVAVTLNDGLVRIVDGDQEVTLEVLVTTIALEDLASPARYEARAQLELAGPVQVERASLVADGQFVLSPADGSGLSATATLNLLGVDLAWNDWVEKNLNAQVFVDYGGDRVQVGVEVESAMLTGQASGALTGLEAEQMFVEGLTGEFQYLPDAVGPLLAPYAPVTVSGSELEELRLSYDGPLGALTPEALLADASGSSSMQVGRIEAFGLDATGGLSLTLGEGRLSLGGDLVAGGGALSLGARYSQDGARLNLRVDGARATAGLAPLLGKLHPVFAGLDGVEGAGLDGLLVAELELGIDGAVPLSGITEGFDLSRVHGGGSIGLDDARLTGSPLLGNLLQTLGRPTETRLDLAPMAFSLDGGRVRYDEPWRWKIGDVATSFTGGVGLDGALDLEWHVPITAELAAKHKLLARLVGKQLSVPLTGTMSAPKLDWAGALKGLAGEALESVVKDKLGDKLGDVLGDKLDLDAILGGGDAAAILAEADRLWTAGSQAEAKTLYLALREDHKLTVVYALNKTRIKDRSQ